MKLKKALEDKNLVQSFSGVRTIFGFNKEISKEQEELVAFYGFAYGYLFLKLQTETFIIGRDPRPTGTSICKALAKGFLIASKLKSTNLKILNLGIITTPLLETAVRALKADGGVIITASHNPINHNGFKFLTGESKYIDGISAPPGALLSSEQMEDIIEFINSEESIRLFNENKNQVTTTEIEKAINIPENETKRVIAERAYLDSIGNDWGITPHCLKPFTLGPALIDPNGGAGSGIDSRVLEHFGVKTVEINNEIGYPVHPVDTDNIDPSNGKHTLLRLSRETKRNNCKFGIAFDYDADRGNLVLPGDDESAVIMPQTVAAFNIALSLTRLHKSKSHLAVVMSDCTSLISEKIASAFEAKVFYVETGEINVVTKMYELRNEGYTVPIGVEGANGGTIFASSTCRDGLQVALAAAIVENEQEINHTWINIAKKTFKSMTDFKEKDFYTLKDLVDSIPVNYNAMEKLELKISDHILLKEKIEKTLNSDIAKEINTLFPNKEIFHYEGTKELDKPCDGTGGWKVKFTNPTETATVFIRGSRTEAGIFRLIIDAETKVAFDILKSFFEDTMKDL